MDLSPVHPGPVADQILVLLGDHRSAYVWDGHVLDQTLRARRLDDLWDFLRERAFHARVVHRLRATGFLRIFEIGRMRLDWSLIMALIERWRPETHIFHLPTGEATITLQDVQVLYGLRVDGLAVTLSQYIRAMTRPQYLDLLGKYIGFRSQGEAAIKGGSHISVTAIRYWGAAVLAYLYRSMCRASIGTQVDICGFLPLLQFIWTPYSDELLADLLDYCLIDRLLWSTSVPMMCLDVVEHHAIERVLRQFDRLQTIPREPA
uniref:Serine/threonine-protein phosphatase 7 long form homolog n=1 Tax=Nicotiana tabacum TaxID=4097 RepID=A0A1S4B1W6_TOBAC|nr:PREDICTED: serine/threonine-protein phosphatase 7 long form homolog [Nicotiana tabacum]